MNISPLFYFVRFAGELELATVSSLPAERQRPCDLRVCNCANRLILRRKAIAIDVEYR